MDAKGVPVPEAALNVTFTLTGPGRLAAVGNGNPRDTGSFHRNTRRTWMGRVVAIVQSTGAGTITITASAPGIAQSAFATIQANPNAPDWRRMSYVDSI